MPKLITFFAALMISLPVFATVYTVDLTKQFQGQNIQTAIGSSDSVDVYLKLNRPNVSLPTFDLSDIGGTMKCEIGCLETTSDATSITYHVRLLISAVAAGDNCSADINNPDIGSVRISIGDLPPGVKTGN